METETQRDDFTTLLAQFDQAIRNRDAAFLARDAAIADAEVERHKAVAIKAAFDELKTVLEDSRNEVARLRNELRIAREKPRGYVPEAARDLAICERDHALEEVARLNAIIADTVPTAEMIRGRDDARRAAREVALELDLTRKSLQSAAELCDQHKRSAEYWAARCREFMDESTHRSAQVNGLFAEIDRTVAERNQAVERIRQLEAGLAARH